MSINLQKGASINLNKCIDLSKRPAGLSKLVVGLGWDVNTKLFRGTYDLDAMAAYLTSDGKLTSSRDFVYFGNKNTHGCYLTGDNLTGEGDGDDEQLIVTLQDVPNNVQHILFSVIIYSAKSKHQTFGEIDNAFIRVEDSMTGVELCRYDLGKQFSDEVGVVIGALDRVGNEWQFTAIGEGYKNIDHKSLRDGLSSYGLNNLREINHVKTELKKERKGFLSSLFGNNN